MDYTTFSTMEMLLNVTWTEPFEVAAMLRLLFNLSERERYNLLMTLDFYNHHNWTL